MVATCGIHHFTRGRYALREGYRLAGIGPGVYGASLSIMAMLEQWGG